MAAPNPIFGILLLILSSWSLSGLDASGKWIMGAGASLILLCWVRYTVHLGLILMITLPSKGPSILRIRYPGLQMLRGTVALVGTFTFFTALHYLPQAEATAINFLSPLLMLAVAPWVLNEPMRISRWVAAATGFAGVLIIIRPSSGLDMVGVAWGLTTACLFAVQHIVTRKLALDDAFSTLIWGGITGSVLSSILVPFHWQEISSILSGFSLTQWLILLSTGFWGGLGHLLQIQAYQRAPASMLAPFLYLQIVSAATLGWLVWGHFPDALTWLGISIICCSGIVIGIIEWRRQARTQA